MSRILSLHLIHAMHALTSDYFVVEVISGAREMMCKQPSTSSTGD